MKPIRMAVTVSGVLVAFAGALVPLLLLDGERRTLGFRVYALVLGLVALRAVVGFVATAGEAPPETPFKRPWRLRLDRRGRAHAGHATTATAADRLATGASESAGAFHFRLRPILRDAADVRLRLHHGLTVDDERAAALLGPRATALLTAERPAPTNRRAPGPTPEELHALLTAIEDL